MEQATAVEIAAPPQRVWEVPSDVEDRRYLAGEADRLKARCEQPR